MSDLDYLEMLEVPVNSCEVVIKPQKRKKRNVIDEVIDKVNNQVKPQKSKRVKPERVKPVADTEQTVTVKSSKFDIVSVQVVAIFALIVGIILTNIFWENSGMNNLLKTVFGEAETKNTAVYSSFSPLAPSKSSEITLDGGVMTFSEGSVYSPCDGVVESVVQNQNTYTVTVRHSDSFTTVISGLEFCYAIEGESVYGTLPLGYSSSEIKVSLFDNDAVLTCYTLSGDEILWVN